MVAITVLGLAAYLVRTTVWGLADAGVTVTPTLRERAKAAVPTISTVATIRAANRLGVIDMPPR